MPAGSDRNGYSSHQFVAGPPFYGVASPRERGAPAPPSEGTGSGPV